MHIDIKKNVRHTGERLVRSSVLVLFLLSTCNEIALAGVTLGQDVLVTTYSQDTTLCKGFHSLYSSFDECPLTDGYCFVFKWASSNDNPAIRKAPLQELSTNQYGYTQISVAHTFEKPYAIVYLNGFQGDRHPRLQETWKVNAKELQYLIERDPHPLPYEQWVKGGHGIKKETYAPEFASLMSRSEKLSDDWSTWLPVFVVDGIDYAVTRECAGNWKYGGYYDCNRIIKIKVKRISSDRKATPVCEFAKPKKPKRK